MKLTRKSLLVTAKNLGFLAMGVVVYHVSAGLGLEMLVKDSQQTPLLWLPAGLGILIAIKMRVWGLPAVAIGAFISQYVQVDDIRLALLFSLAYTLGAAVTVGVLDYIKFNSSLERLQDVMAFLGMAVIANCIISSGLTSWALYQYDPETYGDFFDLAAVRWLADALGVLVLAPPLLVWHAKTRLNWQNRQAVEVLIWMSGLITIGAMVFRNWAPTDTLRYPLELTMFPLQAWAAIRFGQRGATAGALIISLLAVWELQDVLGPDATNTITQPPGYLWVFVGVLTSTSLVLAAVVTEHQHREDNISRQEERLRTIMEAMPDMSFVITESGRYIDVFSSAIVRTNNDVRRLLGRCLADVHPPDVAARMMQAVRTALETQALQIVEYPGWDDRSRLFEGRVSPMQMIAASGDERRVTWVAHDITDRHDYEERLKNARDAADAANMAKSEFLAIMSHEIRTPMNAILGFADILGQTEIAPDQREYIKIISRSGKDLLELINNILDYSKIESRAITLESVPFRMEDTVVEALELVLQKAHAKRIKINYTLEDASGGVFIGDSLRLRQILLNLINNAVKFTKEGHVHVRVRTATENGRLWKIQIAVEDTGIGIPVDKFDRLFKPFSQIDSSTTRQHGGTGLGLIISKRLAEKMGGDIQCVSKVGEGSTFIVSIALESADKVVAPSEPAADNSVDDTFSARHPMRCAVVDHEPTGRQLTLDGLQQLGYTTAVALPDMVSLQNVLRSQAVDIIFINVHLCSEDVGEPLRKLRQGVLPQPMKDTWVVGLSTLPIGDEKERCLAAGYNDYLAKPVTLSRLKGTLSRAVEASGGKSTKPSYLA
ncbi:MAG: ATP-binding protein [Verrucomicrobiota bacterium]|nr:ATP-binding protein [Verrucomicrobiota bacterium]